MGAASEEYAFPFAFPNPLLFRRRVRAPAVAVYRRFPAESSNHGGELITSGSGSFIMPPLLVVPELRWREEKSESKGGVYKMNDDDDDPYGQDAFSSALDLFFCCSRQPKGFSASGRSRAEKGKPKRPQACQRGGRA